MGRRAGQARRPQVLAGRRTSGGERASWGRSEERSGPSLGLVRSIRERHAYFHPLGESGIRQPCQRWCGQPHPARHYAHAVSITEDAPTVAPPEQRPSHSPSGAWWFLVATCVLLLVAVA